MTSVNINTFSLKINGQDFTFDPTRPLDKNERLKIMLEEKNFSFLEFIIPSAHAVFLIASVLVLMPFLAVLVVMLTALYSDSKNQTPQLVKAVNQCQEFKKQIFKLETGDLKKSIIDVFRIQLSQMKENRDESINCQNSFNCQLKRATR